MTKTNSSKPLLVTTPYNMWERIGRQRRAGVLVPLFSVYSQESTGIADLLDLKLLVDWAALSGNSIIQLLPMNEMGPVFCPYDAISSFALEPVYMCLKPFRADVKNLRKRCPLGRPYVDYAIKKEKGKLLRSIYAKEKENNPEFEKFQGDNVYWLKDFALYKALKEKHDGFAWYDWEDKFKNRNSRALADFKKAHLTEINFQMWVQWQLYQQFKAAKGYSEEKKVLLKGDLPILVSRDSADVWAHQEFFKLDYASGAPADMYCAKGQRWGMPTYNWERIEADGYRYLKEKLKYAENFYDILRIDHVVGLFRIWSIHHNEPLENKGLNGFFDPEDENKWRGRGRNILTAMLDTDMLLCAEDLGLIPKVCPETLKELGIPGNDVQRWVKDWKIKHDFLKPQDYRELAVTMLSTHDTSNFPAWWENEAGTVDSGLFIKKCSDHRQINFDAVKDKLFDVALSRRGRLRWLREIDSVDKLVDILGKRKEELADFISLYENSYQEKEKLWKHLKLSGPMKEKSDAEVVGAALKITLESSAIFCINTIIDYLYLADIFKGDPYQYRINTPGTISDKNWSLTIPLSLEELSQHKVNKDIRKMIVACERLTPSKPAPPSNPHRN